MTPTPGTEPLAMRRPLRHLALGMGLVGLGAALALVLPPALTGVGLLLAVLRVCWLEDNIKSDLLGADRTPANHVQPLRERAAFLGGDMPDGVEHAPLLATALRGQAQAWWAATLGAVAVLMATGLGWPPVAALAAMLAALWLAARQVDRLVAAIVHLEAGRPLPEPAPGAAHRWSRSSRMDD